MVSVLIFWTAHLYVVLAHQQAAKQHTIFLCVCMSIVDSSAAANYNVLECEQIQILSFSQGLLTSLSRKKVVLYSLF